MDRAGQGRRGRAGGETDGTMQKRPMNRCKSIIPFVTFLEAVAVDGRSGVGDRAGVKAEKRTE